MKKAVAGQLKRGQLKIVLSGAGRLSSRAGTATSHQPPTERSFAFKACPRGRGCLVWRCFENMNDKILKVNRPLTDFLRVLSALNIPWREDAGNGRGPAVIVELDEETDKKLLAVWEELTELQYRYVAACQGADHIQLVLPMSQRQEEADEP